MVRGWAIAMLAAGCGRVGFEPATQDGSGDGATIEDAPGSLIDDVFLAGETTSLVIDRGTTASYFDATGTMVFAGPAEPRFDHDPNTHEPLGLLVESSAFNETRLSEQLDDDPEWFANGNMAVAANLAVAPDGAMTADALVDDDTAMECRRAQIHLAQSSLPFTCSAFVKAGTLSRMTLGCELLDGTAQIQTSMVVDLATGAIVQAPPSAIAFGVETIGNGWFRPWIALQNNTSGNTTGVLSFFSELGNNAAVGTYFGWGAQFEIGERPTSYIPNATTDRVLRGAENSRLFVPSAMIQNGSVRVVARPKHDVPTAAACVIAAGTERVCVARNAALDAMSIAVVGTSTANLGHGAWPLGSSRWGGFTYGYDEMTVHGVSDNGTSDASWSLTSAPSQILLGTDLVSRGVVHLQRLTFWTTRITGSELAALSP